MNALPLLCAASAVACLTALPLAAQSTTRVSVTTSGQELPAPGGRWSSMSGNGRFVVFNAEDSAALVPGDTNGFGDVFVKDLVTGTVVCASTTSNGQPANHGAGGGRLSADGRFVAFESQSTNLATTTQGWSDIYVKDLVTGAIQHVSKSSAGFGGAGGSSYPEISADGRYVCFLSDAPNLVANDGNDLPDVFVFDRSTQTLECMTVDAGGATTGVNLATWEMPASISADGRFVAFDTLPATVGSTGFGRVVAVRDRVAGTVTALNMLATTTIVDAMYPRISADGSTVVFMTTYPFDPTDVDGALDVYAVDLTTGSRSLVSKSTGTQSYHAATIANISATGRFVTFTSREAFDAADTNNSDDAFVADRATGAIERVSVGPGGVAANSYTRARFVSDDGRWVVFDSAADNLVAGDTNGASDTFLRDRAPAAAKSLYGTGVAGANGTVPTLSLLAPPVLGTSTPLHLDNPIGAPTAALLVLGFQQIAVPFLNGTLLASTDVLEVVIVPAAGLTRSLAIPNVFDFAGISLFLQGLELDTIAVGGVSFTRGLRATIGG